MRAFVFGLTMLAVATTATAQPCAGDTDNDGVVTVAELVRGVRSALVGCAEAAPAGCATDFTQPGACTFAGFFGEMVPPPQRFGFNCLRYDDRRPFTARVISDGERLTLVLMNDPETLLHATVTSPNTAELTDWSYHGASDGRPTNGLVQLINDRTTLDVPPNPTRTFALFGCAFDWGISATYVGP